MRKARGSPRRMMLTTPGQAVTRYPGPSCAVPRAARTIARGHPTPTNDAALNPSRPYVHTGAPGDNAKRRGTAKAVFVYIRPALRSSAPHTRRPRVAARNVLQGGSAGPHPCRTAGPCMAVGSAHT
jgi:hypothetical protein